MNDLLAEETNLEPSYLKHAGKMHGGGDKNSDKIQAIKMTRQEKQLISKKKKNNGVKIQFIRELRSGVVILNKLF